jgi:hypothetical protein
MVCHKRGASYRARRFLNGNTNKNTFMYRNVDEHVENIPEEDSFTDEGIQSKKPPGELDAK